MFFFFIFQKGTFPNNSSRGRMIQYMYATSLKDASIGPLFNNPDIFPPDFTMTELGRKVFGFDKWE